MDIKRNCQFIVDKEKDKEDGKLRYRIKWNDNKNIVAFNVGCRIEFEKWSRDTQRCKNNSTHGKKKIQANIINREIQRYEQMAEQTFNSFELLDKIPTKEEFRAAFNLVNGKEETKTETDFIETLNKFTSEVGLSNDWTPATFEKFAAMKNHLTTFKHDITFEFLDEYGLNDYVIFLREVKDMRNSTIAKQLGFLKWFLRWATAKHYCTQRAFETFSPKLKTAEKKVIFLDWDELMTVYNFEFPENKSYLARVRDVFCFCCFTSLRYSDVANLRRPDVYDNHIEIVTIKTTDSLKIELNDYSKSILEKYKTEQFNKDLVLPVISNQRMNEYLKEMGELCGIDTPIRETYYKGNQRFDDVFPKYALLGTHAGRRTFICNALMMGIPAQIVMKWTGHSDYKAMKPYIDVADQAKESAMSLFNQKSPIAKNRD